MLSQEELQRIKSGFDIIGNDATLNYAVELAYRAAFTDLTVLVTGESGVGKESIPKIVNFSDMKKAPLPGLRKNGKDISKKPTGEPSSSTRLPNSRFLPRPNC